MEDLLVVGGLIVGTWLLLLWLSIIVWVYRDIRERTRDIGLQVLAVFVVMMFFPGFNIPGLALYLMMRPRESLEEAYSRSLEEEALLREIGDEGLCPSCRRFVERSWRVCPFCQTQLKDMCHDCQQLLSFNWVVCPFCTAERKTVTRGLAPMPPPAVATASRQEAAARAASATPDGEASTRTPARAASAATEEETSTRTPARAASAATEEETSTRTPARAASATSEEEASTRTPARGSTPAKTESEDEAPESPSTRDGRRSQPPEQAKPAPSRTSR
jgi:RNA polymerase subunit RPABC4/transcription elongation factor Spt4